MKKFTAIICTIILAASFILPMSAAPAINATELGAYGQLTIYAGEKATLLPLVDGSISADEYTTSFHYTPETEGMVNEITNQAGLASYIDVYISYTDDYIYLGAVVQENDYLNRGSSASDPYSYFAMNLGFDLSGSSIKAADRLAMTLSIRGENDYFSGNGYLVFSDTGSYTTSWSYNSTLITEKLYTRGKDADNKDITTYEVCVSKEIIKTAFSLETLPDRAFFYFEHRPTVNGATCGKLRYQHNLSTDEKVALITEYGWAPSFLGNMLVFGVEPEAPVTTVPDETTVPTVTTPTVTTPTVTTPTATTPVVLTPTTNNPETTEAPGTTAPDDSGCSGVGGLFAAMQTAIVAAGVAFLITSKKH